MAESYARSSYRYLITARVISKVAALMGIPTNSVFPLLVSTPAFVVICMYSQ